MNSKLFSKGEATGNPMKTIQLKEGALSGDTDPVPASAPKPDERPKAEPMSKPLPELASSHAAQIEQAEARVEHAEARTEHAEARTEKAEARTEQAEARTERAEARTEEAKTRTEQAEVRRDRLWSSPFINCQTCGRPASPILLISPSVAACS